MTNHMIVMEKMMKDMMMQLRSKPTAAGDRKDGGKGITFKYPRNMGGYCHSCGFHLVGPKHDSETCT